MRKNVRTFTASAALILMLILLCWFTGCGGGTAEGDRTAENSGSEQGGSAGDRAAGSDTGAGDGKHTLTIAEQYGLAYAPLQIMRRMEYLERELPEYTVSWQRLGNTAAIRESMLAGAADVGFMGIPPFLIGYDRGMEWKIFTGLSEAPLGLVTWRDDIDGLQDFGPRDRIVLPQPGSIQHILLTMACERQLGSAGALDDNLVTMNHPDGMQALLNRREVSAHFTSPPYLMLELAEPGMKMVLTGREAMGGRFTFIVGVAGDRLLDSDPGAADALRRALSASEDYMRENPSDTVQILSEEYGIDPAKLGEYLNWEGLQYGRDVLGVDRFIGFMLTHGYLNKSFEAREVVFDSP